MIENEIKCITKTEPTKIPEIVDKYSGALSYVEQSYINGSRIRKSVSLNVASTLNSMRIVGQPQYIHTTKHATKHGLVEVEVDITEKDYTMLYPYSEEKIKKLRVKIKQPDVLWDIDFLFRSDFDLNFSLLQDNAYLDDFKKSFYISLAECEMPEHWAAPKTFPDFVQEDMVYMVPQSEAAQWCNKCLSDVDYTLALIEEKNAYRHKSQIKATASKTS